VKVQRRLFLFFILFSLAPVMVVMAIGWQINQDLFTYLDSPGIRNSLESSLTMARALMEGEKRELTDIAGELSAAISSASLNDSDPLPAPASDCSYILLSQGSTAPWPARGEPAIIAALAEYTGEYDRVRRVEVAGNPGLLTTGQIQRGGEPCRLVLFRHLDRELLGLMDSVVQGGGRFRQLRLYYGDLLRSDTLFILAALGLILLLTSLWLSLRLSRQIGRPLKELVAGTEKVAAGDLECRVDVRAPDEVGDLVSAFNRMTARLQESQVELLRAERVAAWQGIARRLAHEIKNPLTPITLAMHRLSRRSDDRVLTECVKVVLEETANLQRLADEFSSFARLPAPVTGGVDLAELLRESTELYLEDQPVRCQWEGWPPEGVPVEADAGQIRQVFGNLIKNAMEAMAGEGTITLTFRNLAGERVMIAIEDSGPGFTVPAAEIFVPYFTSKETGTGLGLAIARRIVEDHGGELKALAPAGGGAVFQITLPVSRTERQPSTREVPR
jgi:nitrogen fixation/metabolism regulation signal transduction histidine kinase